MNPATSVRAVRVWDIPTRIFHWSLLALLLTSWFTGEEKGAAALHRYAGEAIAGLIVFRLIWGFLGGEHARFASFAAGPRAIFAHIRDLFSAAPKRHLGHNPLGGIAVFLLMTTITALVITGLFSSGEHNAGPFAGVAGEDVAELHEALFRVLQALVVLHLLGVLIESLKAKDALVPAMITGIKHRRADEPGQDARRGATLALLGALTAGLAVAISLAVQPVAPISEARGGEPEWEHDYEWKE